MRKVSMRYLSRHVLMHAHALQQHTLQNTCKQMQAKSIGVLLGEGDVGDEGRDARSGELPREDVLDGLRRGCAERQVQSLRGAVHT